MTTFRSGKKISYLVVLVVLYISIFVLPAISETPFSIDFFTLEHIMDLGWQPFPANYTFEIYDEYNHFISNITSFITDDQIREGFLSQVSLPNDVKRLIIKPVQPELQELYQMDALYDIDLSNLNNDHFSLYAYTRKGYFSVSCYFEDGRPCAGTEFIMTHNGNGTQIQFVTNENGFFQPSSAVPAGEYTLKNTKEPIGGVRLEKETLLTVPIYDREQVIQEASLAFNSITAENSVLSAPFVTALNPVPSLLSGDQEVTLQLKGFGLGANTLPISTYSICLYDILLTDTLNQMLSVDNAFVLHAVTYQNNSNQYMLRAEFYNCEGAWLDDAVIGPMEEYASVPPDTVFVILSYENALSPLSDLGIGFDGGTIALHLTCSETNADILEHEAQGVSLKASVSWMFKGSDTIYGGEEQYLHADHVLLPGIADLSAVCHMSKPGRLEVFLSNNGGVPMPVSTYDLLLPKGWRAVTYQPDILIYKMTNSDLLRINIDEPINPGQTAIFSIDMAEMSNETDAIIWVENERILPPTADNPLGFIIRSDSLYVNPRVGSAAGSLYVQIPLLCETPSYNNDSTPIKTLSGRVFNDKNGNGILDLNEAGIAGITVQITEREGHPIFLSVSDENGFFIIPYDDESDLLRLHVLLPDYMQVILLDMDERGYLLPEGMQIPVSVSRSISGVVGFGDIGMPNIIVSLYKEESLIDDVLVTSVRSDVNGTYRVTHLTPGVYRVVFSLPSEYEDQYYIPLADQYTSVDLSGDNNECIVSTAIQLYGSLSVQAVITSWNEDIVVFDLQNDQGSHIRTMTADSNGTAVFSGLMPGDYIVKIHLPGSLLMSGGMPDVTMTSIQNGMDTKVEFNVIQASRVIGEVLYNTESVSVTLNGDDLIIENITTGEFDFTSLYEGVFTVTVKIPDKVNVEMAENTWERSDGVAVFNSYIAQGETLRLPSLTFYNSGSISGTILNESSLDDDFPTNNTGCANIRIALHKREGNVYIYVTETYTDINGLYTFHGLKPGLYRLEAFADPDKSFLSLDNQFSIMPSGWTNDLELTDGLHLNTVNGLVSLHVSLKAAVFLDSNENGIRGIYERPVPEVLVEVLFPYDDSVIASGITDKEGFVLFTSLTRGECRVRFSLPERYGFTKKEDGFSLTTSAVTNNESSVAVTDVLSLQHGSINEVAAGVTEFGTVMGRAWYDENGNGIMEAHESGQAGITVALVPKRSTGTTYTVTTGADGYYLFNNVREGSYDLVVNTPEGLMFTRFSSTGRDKRSIFTGEGKTYGAKLIDVLKRKTLSDLNIGFIGEAFIVGKVFKDETGMGLYNGEEEGLAGVRVTVEKAANNAELGTYYSEADGVFRISSLRGGEYRLRILLPEDGSVFTKTVHNGVVGNSVPYRAGRRDGVLDNISIKDGTQSHVYIGVTYYGSLTGSVYFDADYSGDRQTTEAPVAGVEVRLYDEFGIQVKRTNTSENGLYSFYGLMPGAYYVEMSTLMGYTYVVKEGVSVISSTNNLYGKTKLLTVLPNQETSGIDGGLIIPGIVRGAAFLDDNDNGIKDNEEKGFPGIQIKLVDQMHLLPDTSAITDSSGAYSFSSVMPGTYFIQCEALENARFSSNFSHIIQSQAFIVSSGQIVDLPDLGVILPSIINGVVFFEQDDESRISNAPVIPFTDAEVMLIPSDNKESYTASVAQDGSFQIADIRPGEYTFKLSFIDGKVLSYASTPLFHEFRGQAQINVPFIVENGMEPYHIRFGVAVPSTLSGVLFIDSNNNGVQDEDEGGTQGLVLELLDEKTGKIEARTSPLQDGSFSFTGVLPSVYTVSVVIPRDYILLTGNAFLFHILDEGVIGANNIKIRSDSAYDGLIAGLIQSTSLGGFVLAESGDQHIAVPDLVINLLSENGIVSQTVMTDEDGGYIFEGVMPGKYYLSTGLPDGYLLVDFDDNTQERLQTVIRAENSGKGRSEEIDVLMGINRYDLDIIAVQPGGLGDKAWFDENGNGLQDTGERPISGVLIEVIKDNRVIKSTQTNASGYYLIEDIYPGVYDIRVTIPIGLLPTVRRMDIPLLVSVLSDAQDGIAVVRNTEIPSGVINRNFDFGFILENKNFVPDAIVEITRQVWQ